MKTLKIAALAGIITLAGCSSSDDKNTAAPSDGSKQSASETSKASNTPSSSETSPSSSSSSQTSSATAAPFSMPNELGKKLQAAQDDVQRVSGNPLYPSFSDDALGTGRPQIVDSHWKVCSQSPAAGTTVTAGTEVRFKAVKLDESCP